MKPITTTILALLFSSATYAQKNLSAEGNALRADSLQREIINYVEPGCSGENILWDVAEDSKQQFERAIIQTYSINGQLVMDDSYSLTTYSAATDSMLISRIETPLYQMDYSAPIVAMTFPFQYGNNFSAPFAGTGNYERKFALEETGTNNVTADGYGSLILAEGDTLRNVLRVHTQRNTDVRITGMIGGKELGILKKSTDIYEWYAHGYRYPVLKSVKENILQDTTLLRSTQVSFVINRTEQEGMEDIVNEEIRRNDSIAYAASNPMSNMHVETNGYTATVTYDLATDAHISMTLANSQGMVFWRYEDEETAGNNYRHEVPLTGLLRGQYVIHLNANGQIYSSKVNVE